ncbi:MAG: hypothetical protein RR365_00950 [Bacteroides sp.]
MGTIALNSVLAFDATLAYVFSFECYGFQPSANRLTIYDNSTGAAVYNVRNSSTQSSKHPLAANTLINGKSYYAKITAYYNTGNTEQSLESSASGVFKCLSTPVWKLDISPGATIGMSSHGFTVTYTQAQNETVDEYQIDVYSASHTLFWSSGILYDTSISPAVSGLANGEIYFVRAHGVTTHGMELDTRVGTTDINFSVEYNAPGLYSLAYLEQNKYGGWVSVSTNIASIEGKSGSASPVVYVENKAIDLTSANASVVFDSNFKTGKSFIIQYSGKSFTVNNCILEIRPDSGPCAKVFLRSGTFNSTDGVRQFLELRVLDAVEYVIYSNKIVPPNTADNLMLWIQRKNGLYKIVLANMNAGGAA